MPCLFGVLVFAKLALLSPRALESPPGELEGIDPADLEEPAAAAATAIPTEAPDTAIERFDYLATSRGVREWRILAQRALLYQTAGVVHGRTIEAFLFDSLGGPPTRVTGLESRYEMKGRDLEIFGDVRTEFPDGFVIESPYLKYLPAKRRLEIPVRYAVHGQGLPGAADESRVEFRCHGLDHDLNTGVADLLADVVLEFFQKPAPGRGGVPERTEIRSDRGRVLRADRTAHFTMKGEGYVKVRQPKLFGRGRQGRLRYGGGVQKLRYLELTQDVLIVEDEVEQRPGQAAKYATGGRAEFDAAEDLITLTEYPQAYQGGDTVTGERILVHRTTDVVEVEGSNAYSSGEEQTP